MEEVERGNVKHRRRKKKVKRIVEHRNMTCVYVVYKIVNENRIGTFNSMIMTGKL